MKMKVTRRKPGVIVGIVLLMFLCITLGFAPADTEAAIPQTTEGSVIDGVDLSADTGLFKPGIGIYYGTYKHATALNKYASDVSSRETTATPILWQTADSEATLTDLPLVSKYVLDYETYFPYTSWSQATNGNLNYWRDSRTRAVLNNGNFSGRGSGTTACSPSENFGSTGFLNNFIDVEKNQIPTRQVTTGIYNATNTFYGNSRHTTNDRIFLPWGTFNSTTSTSPDRNKVGYTINDRQGDVMTPFATNDANKKKATLKSGTAAGWWLRSYNTNDATSNLYVNTDGNVSSTSVSYKQGTRPMFHMLPDNILFAAEIVASGGDGMGTINAGGGYVAGTGGNKNYKLTVSADRYKLLGLSFQGDAIAADGSSVIRIRPGNTVSLVGSTALSPGTYNYKIVTEVNGARRIVGYGVAGPTGGSNELSIRSVDKANQALADGNYTVYVWVQYTSTSTVSNSIEASRPMRFTLNVNSFTENNINVSDGVDFSTTSGLRAADAGIYLGRYKHATSVEGSTVNYASSDTPILWQPKGSVQGERYIPFLSTYVVDARAYAASTSHQNWSNAALCQFLNGNFGQGFSISEMVAMRAKYGVEAETTAGVTINAAQRMVVPKQEEAANNGSFGFSSNTQRRATLKNSSQYLSWWLRTPSGTSAAYQVNNTGALTTGAVNGVQGVRPAFMLDMQSVVFAAEIGGSGIGAINADGTNYVEATNGKNYKLTVLGENNGADVGTLTGVPTTQQVADASGLPVSGLTASQTGAAYTIQYKVVAGAEGQRRIVGYGGAAATSTALIVQTSHLDPGTYTVHMWLQRNSDKNSNQCGRPASFRMKVEGNNTADVSDGVDLSAATGLFKPGTLLYAGTFKHALDRAYGTPVTYEAESAPILWQVAAQETNDDNLTLFSKYLLDFRSFNGAETYVLPTAALRLWLNDEFLDSFNTLEDWAIPLTTVTTSQYHDQTGNYVANSTVTTRDKAFLAWGSNDYGNNNASMKNRVWYTALDRINNAVPGNAVLDNEAKKATTRSGTTPLEWWLRSRTTSGNPYYTFYVTNQGIVHGVSLPRDNNGVRPLIKLDPQSIVFASQIGGESIGATPVDADNYKQEGAYKLTLLGAQNGAAVGTLTGVPSSAQAARNSGFTVNNLTASQTGSDYSINYKIVQEQSGVRKIVAYGSTAASQRSITLDTSKLLGGAHTVHMWLQKNNALSSNECSLPSSFVLNIDNNAATPEILSITPGKTMYENQSHTLTVSARPVTDGGTLSYQWYHNTVNNNSTGEPIDGAKGASFKIENAEPGTHYYYAVVTNTNSNVTGNDTVSTASSVVTMVINAVLHAEKPVLTAEPQDSTAVVGDPSITLSAAVNPISDGGTLTCQWYVNGTNDTSSGTKIVGATGTTCTVAASPQNVGTKYYYFVATNTNNAASITGDRIVTTTSRAAKVVIKPLVDAATPSITQHPTSQSVTHGDDVRLEVAASVADGGTMSYQWYSNAQNSTNGGVPISHEEAAVYTFNSGNLSVGTHYYYVVVTNTNASPTITGNPEATATSLVASVTVNKRNQAALTITGPANKTYGDDDFNVSYIGGSTAGEVTVDVVSGGDVLSVKNNKTLHIKKTGSARVTVTMAGNAIYKDITSPEFTITIAKGVGAAIPAVTGSYQQVGETYTYTIDAIDGAEYRRDDKAFQDSPVFTGLEPTKTYTFSARIKETANATAGPIKTGDPVTLPKFTPASSPPLVFAIDDSDTPRKVIVTAVNNAEYSFDDGAYSEDTREYTPPVDGPVKIAIRYKETAIYAASAPTVQEISTLKQNQGMPATFTIAPVLNGDKKTYTVTIPPTAGCEYSFDGTTYDVDNKKIDCQPNTTVTVYKRYAETEDFNASSPRIVTVKIPALNINVPPPPPPESYTLTLSVGERGTLKKGANGQYGAGERIEIAVEPAPGYAFDHWTASSQSVSFENANAASTAFVMPAENVTVTAHYVDNKTVKLTIEGLDAQSKVIYSQDRQVRPGESVQIKAPAINGYTVQGERTQTVKLDQDGKITFRYQHNTGKLMLQKEKHFAYLSGYPDQTVGPDRSITRAEVSVILHRLVVAEDKEDPLESDFRDVLRGDANHQWFYQAVTYLSQRGIILGYADGTFRPNQNITRAEFVTMVSRFEEMQTGSIGFSDAQDHWALASIQNAVAKGWVSGYPDGTFKPEQNITRAEAVKIINTMLGRDLEKSQLPSNLSMPFSDLKAGHWCYANLIEATTTHLHEIDASGQEIWRPE